MIISIKKIIILLIIASSIPSFAYNPQISDLKKTSSAFNMVAQKANPSVVSISTVSTVRHSSPFMNDPFFNHYYRYGGQQQQKGLGSGVIVSESGHILTNHHVVSKADEINITLSDGREFSAHVIGSDKKTDLALLKIEGSSLPSIHLGNSDSLSVGDWAIAIGNPFGLNGSVTVGIISATGRSGVVDAENYADFIQTDAAINPGNSGGALLNIDGKLIGINTAIFSQSGGYMGIGFAIPVNMAKRVMDDLLKYGKVRRGMLGVTIKPITDDDMLDYNLTSREGAFVLEVKPGSTADKAGIKPFDVIIEIGGKKVSDYLSLRTRISELKLGEPSYCVVLRKNREKSLSFTLEHTLGTSQKTPASLGLNIQSLSSDTRQQFAIPNHINGIIITSVEPGSIAAQYRLVPGLVITKLNRKRLKSAKDFNRYFIKNKANLFTLYESGYEFSVVISPH
ncbi:hypothetical protein DID78_01955 [Candidatus Marinamargulisbacteria bacterium SCGC AG-343-D04]|nr:hypothetical protein DID78_01955 [Candidatus Marinamargulisbacteria bacterium SCGC AG-343-D04]